MGRRETGHGGRQTQIAGLHTGAPPGPPLREHPRPLGIPVGAVQRQTAGAARAPGSTNGPTTPVASITPA